MSRPVIALLTDFGTADHYVGAMKGAILGVAPDAALVDITHEIPPHDILAGSLQLGAAARYFPAASVFVAVVDPGVGSRRRGIALQAGPYRFVGPDNGIFTHALSHWEVHTAVELTASRYWLPVVSRTFEGRDRFGPAAAWLASGVAVEALGPPIHDLRLLDLPRPVLAAADVTGEVIAVDRFGNLVTNIDRQTLETLVPSLSIEVRIAGETVHGLRGSYTEIPPGRVGALIGSTEYLEIACQATSASQHLKTGRGAPVTVTRAGSRAPV